MSSLSLVENLLNEFYLPVTSNARKRDIEGELMSFKNLPSSWHVCLGVAANFEANQFLWFFCTSTVEHAITRRWTQLSTADRAVLRETLWTTYANPAVIHVPRRQRETLAQLIAIMAKREFADDNPNHMRDCLELVRSNVQLGMPLLRIISEEVVNNRDGITTERRKIFLSSMSVVMPDVMDLVTKYLLISVCHLSGKDVNTTENSLIDYTLLPSLPNDNNLRASIIEILKCAQHLVSWVRIDLISEYFLLSILDLSQWRSDESEVSLAALHVLNELLYLPKTVLDVMTLMSGINGLLNQQNSIRCQNEMYDDKFRELLRLYTTKYWAKLIPQNDVFESFLKSLFCFTIAKNGGLDFTEKLEVWTPIIKGLISTSKMDRFFDLVHQLVAEIMRRSRFESNKIELEMLDNEYFDDNMQTEWQQYLSTCFECVALIAESRPKAVFEQVYSHWTRPYVFFMTLENYIDNEEAFELTNKIKCHSFSEQLRDLSSVCQALVRIAPLLGVDAHETTSDVSCHMTLLTDNLLELVNFFNSQKPALLCSEKSELKADLMELFAQVLMALRSLLPISSNLKGEQKLRRLTESVGCVLHHSGTPVIYCAASELLLCITSVVRPKFVFDIQMIVNLFHVGSDMPHLPKPALSNVYTSLISFLILPWRHVDDQQQEFHERCGVLRGYIDKIAHDFLELETSTTCSNSQELKICSTTIELLSILKNVIEFFKASYKISKEMLTSAVKPIIMKSLMLYDLFGIANAQISVSVSDFCLSVLRTLQNQLGPAFVKDVITLFITVSSRDQLTHCRLIIMEKVLQMFQVVIEQPGNSSLAMLPSILDFTIGQVLPIARQNDGSDQSDITYTLYALFDSVLNCKWQYFYKSLIQQNGTVHSNNENMHPDHFMAILTAYGEVLVTGNDPNVVRIVLDSLQRTNEKWSLYSRPLFREKLLTSFLDALLKIILPGEATLNYELLVATLFAMGQVDTSRLCDVLSSMVYPAVLNTEELCSSADIPTFSQKLSQMIQDTHCTRISQTI